MKLIKTEDAVGCVLCHDITQIIKDEKKGVLFKKGHIVKEEDTLWDLAKRYGTTGERILEMNDCEKNGLKSGDKILIFKESLSIL